MKTIMIVLFGALLTGCQSARLATTHQLAYGGGDGSSCEQAVVINDARCREMRELAERLWLEQKYPGYQQTKECSLEAASRHYNRIEFATAQGEARTVYFDASDFVNK
jgi:hypothetical protein